MIRVPAYAVVILFLFVIIGSLIQGCKALFS